MSNSTGSFTKARGRFHDEIPILNPNSFVITFVDGEAIEVPAFWGAPTTVQVFGGEHYASTPFAALDEIWVGVDFCALLNNGTCDFVVHSKELIDNLLDVYGPTVYEHTHRFAGLPNTHTSGFSYTGEVNLSNEIFTGRGQIWQGMRWGFNGRSVTDPNRTLNMWANGSSRNPILNGTNTAYTNLDGYVNVFQGSTLSRSNSFRATTVNFSPEAHAGNAITDESENFTYTLIKVPASGIGFPLNAYSETDLDVISNQNGPADPPFDTVRILENSGGVIYTSAATGETCNGSAETTEETRGRGAFIGTFNAICAELLGLPESYLISVINTNAGASEGNLTFDEITTGDFLARQHYGFTAGVP